jgi:hypothetical protein
VTTRPPGRHDNVRAVVVYSAARLGLLLVCLVLGWLAGLTGLLLIAAAFLASGVLSWFLLQRQRLAMGAAADRSLQRMRDRMTSRTAAEDAYVDALHGDEGGAAEAGTSGRAAG